VPTVERGFADGGLLVHGERGREAVDVLDGGALELAQELAGVGGEVSR
jgi:phage-related minor tail protein